MIRIAICDDDLTFVEILKKRVLSVFEDLCHNVSIEVFTSAQQLLDSSSEFDLYLLDIRMPEFSGIELAKKIRHSASKHDASLIFISSMHEAVFDSLRYAPLRFIRKELLEEELPEAMLAFIQLHQQRTQTEDFILEIKENRTTHSIRISQLYYLEVYGHYLDFHCTDKVIRSRGRFLEYQELLASHSFSLARRGCLVNLSYIEMITADMVILRNGSTLSLSRACRSGLQKDYLKWEREQHHVLTL